MSPFNMTFLGYCSKKVALTEQKCFSIVILRSCQYFSDGIYNVRSICAGLLWPETKKIIAAIKHYVPYAPSLYISLAYDDKGMMEQQWPLLWGFESLLMAIQAKETIEMCYMLLCNTWILRHGIFMILMHWLVAARDRENLCLHCGHWPVRGCRVTKHEERMERKDCWCWRGRRGETEDCMLYYSSPVSLHFSSSWE